LVSSSISNSKRKPLFHEIINGKTQDFLVQIIPEDTQIFDYEITSKEHISE